MKEEGQVRMSKICAVPQVMPKFFESLSSQSYAMTFALQWYTFSGLGLTLSRLCQHSPLERCLELEPTRSLGGSSC